MKSHEENDISISDALKDFIKSQSDNIKAQQDTIKGYQEIIQMLNARLEKPQPKKPQYLYVYLNSEGYYELDVERRDRSWMGKIKLEDE